MLSYAPDLRRTCNPSFSFLLHLHDVTGVNRLYQVTHSISVLVDSISLLCFAPTKSTWFDWVSDISLFT